MPGHFKSDKDLRRLGVHTLQGGMGALLLFANGLRIKPSSRYEPFFTHGSVGLQSSSEKPSWV